MLRVKYGDKRYLCEYDLNTDLFKEFNIEVKDLVPVRSVYVLQTNKGKKILKKLNYGSKRLNFICCALDFIEKSYKNIMKINKNINDENFVCRNGSRYILIDLIEGRECTTSNPVDIEASSKALANLHNSSIGFFDMIKGNEDFKDYIDIYNLEVNLKESLKDLNDFKKQVSRYSYKNEFDNLFYENVDYYIDEINYCIDYLKIIDINKIYFILSN